MNELKLRRESMIGIAQQTTSPSPRARAACLTSDYSNGSAAFQPPLASSLPYLHGLPGGRVGVYLSAIEVLRNGRRLENALPWRASPFVLRRPLPPVRRGTRRLLEPQLPVDPPVLISITRFERTVRKSTS